MEQHKYRFGDRPDGVWLRDLDSLHTFMPYVLRNRADAEAFISETIDLTAINNWLKEKNSTCTENNYSLFQIISMALLKTIVLRPELNRFIQGRRIYQRKHFSLAFVAKKQFADGGAESLLTLRFNDDCTINTIHDSIFAQVNNIRNGGSDNSTDIMDILCKLPRWILRIVSFILRFLDYYGRVPQAIIKDEPNYASVFISNLGSIKLHAGYHHLNNWGTNSIFVVIGEKYLAPYYDESDKIEMREALDIGITLDERISDGYYYAKSIKLLKYLLQHPQTLELPAKEVVNYE